MLHSYNRREFMQHSALAGLGLAVNTPLSAFPDLGFLAPFSPVSRSLAPYFISEDLIRLLQITETNQEIRQAISVNVEHFQIGRAWRIKPDEVMKVLRDTRGKWGSETQQDQAQTQLALVSGWTAHRIIEKHLGEGSVPADLDQPIPESSIYRDVCIMKMIQKADPHRKEVSLDQPVEGVTEAQVEELFHLIQQRNMIRTHTFRPDFADIETWLDQFMLYYDRNKADNVDYARVYCNPDPAKVRQYLTGPVFYDEKDELIRNARNLQMAQVTGSITLKGSPPQSIYGKALAEALQAVHTCNRFGSGGGSEAEVMKVWEA